MRNSDIAALQLKIDNNKLPIKNSRHISLPFANFITRYSGIIFAKHFMELL